MCLLVIVCNWKIGIPNKLNQNWSHLWRGRLACQQKDIMVLKPYAILDIIFSSWVLHGGISNTNTDVLWNNGTRRSFIILYHCFIILG